MKAMLLTVQVTPDGSVEASCLVGDVPYYGYAPKMTTALERLVKSLDEHDMPRPRGREER